MPGVYPPNNLASVLRQLALRLRAVETQQQATYSNLQGQPVITTGNQPGPRPYMYGYQFWNPSTGQPLAFFGEDGGLVALYYYSAEGQKQSQYDETGLHFYDTSGNEVVRLDSTGLHVYDSSDRNRVNLGGLSNGDYGLQVIDPSGQSNEIRPTYSASNYTSGSLNTTLSAIGSAVTATIGESGRALVTGSAYFGIGANMTATGYVYVDGTTATGEPEIVLSNSNSGGIAGTVSATTVVSGLTPGSHSFQIYANVSTGSGSYGETAVTVIPL